MKFSDDETRDMTDIDAGRDLAAALSRQFVDQIRRKGFNAPLDLAYLMAKKMRDYHAEMLTNIADDEAKHYKKLSDLQNSETPK